VTLLLDGFVHLFAGGGVLALLVGVFLGIIVGSLPDNPTEPTRFEANVQRNMTLRADRVFFQEVLPASAFVLPQTLQTSGSGLPVSWGMTVETNADGVRLEKGDINNRCPYNNENYCTSDTCWELDWTGYPLRAGASSVYLRFSALLSTPTMRAVPPSGAVMYDEEAWYIWQEGIEGSGIESGYSSEWFARPGQVAYPAFEPPSTLFDPGSAVGLYFARADFDVQSYDCYVAAIDLTITESISSGFTEWKFYPWAGANVFDLPWSWPSTIELEHQESGHRATYSFSATRVDSGNGSLGSDILHSDWTLLNDWS
jgi:hypothetical protein